MRASSDIVCGVYGVLLSVTFHSALSLALVFRVGDLVKRLGTSNVCKLNLCSGVVCSTGDLIGQSKSFLWEITKRIYNSLIGGKSGARVDDCQRGF